MFFSVKLIDTNNARKISKSSRLDKFCKLISAFYPLLNFFFQALYVYLKISSLNKVKLSRMADKFPSPATTKLR